MINSLGSLDKVKMYNYLYLEKKRYSGWACGTVVECYLRHFHSSWEGLELSSGSVFDSPFLLIMPQQEQVMVLVVWSLIPIWDLIWVPGSWLQPGPALATAGICRVNQQMETLLLCFQINKLKTRAMKFPNFITDFEWHYWGMSDGIYLQNDCI